MNFVNFRDSLVAVDIDTILALFKECQPHVLVVTDTLDFDPGNDFGLTQFVNTLKASTIHGMTPKVTTASRSNDPNADLPNYDFTNATNGLLKSRHDVVFLFGARSEGSSPLPQPQVDAIARFMEAGGGVFATGDHETLGASLCGDVPRVRAMRKWKAVSSPPSASGTNRFSTNLSGPNEGEEFSDQSNTQPQRLYANFRTQAGGTGQPHPLLQLQAPRRILEVFPDHPHEGECLVPASLATDFPLDGVDVPEWPNDLTGAALSPEIVAMSVSHGDGFGAKQALVPKLFAAIVGYDGHRANKGRVSTDATWHHFININIDGTGAGGGFSGLQSPPGTDTEDLIRIREHYVNIATWLMPKKVRKCLRYPRLVLELSRYPLFEELEIPPIRAASAAQLRELGAQVLQSAARRLPAWQAQALLEDTLEDALGEAQARKLLDQTEGLPALQALDVAHAVLGGLVTGVATRLADLKDVREIKPHETLEPVAIEGARIAAKLALADRRSQLKKAEEWLSRVEVKAEIAGR